RDPGGLPGTGALGPSATGRAAWSARRRAQAHARPPERCRPGPRLPALCAPRRPAVLPRAGRAGLGGGPRAPRSLLTPAGPLGLDHGAQLRPAAVHPGLLVGRQRRLLVQHPLGFAEIGAVLGLATGGGLPALQAQPLALADALLDPNEPRGRHAATSSTKAR